MNTPVVFLIYRRPELTQRVFNAIAAARPRQLFVVADGPRDESELERCEATRAVIDQVNWNCDVQTHYADHNLGLRKRISSGLNWVFEQVETAIILEDDCLPHSTFFRYCEELLDYYRDDERVMHISGDNFGYGRPRGVHESYYFSQYAHVWGWATWRRAWARYDVDMSSWPTEQDTVLAKFDRQDERRYWHKQWEATYHRQNKTWAYQWMYTCMRHNGLCVMPYENQISNIGMGTEATHTTNQHSPLANLPTHDVVFPLQHPAHIARDRKGEGHAARLFRFSHVSLLYRICGKLTNRITKWQKAIQN